MFNFTKKNSGADTGIPWIDLNNPALLEEIKSESELSPVLIYKHSTRCSISATVLNRLERSWNPEEMPIKTYYLDLIAYRALSDQIAQDFEVAHESPQVLVIQQGKVVYHSSHFGINYQDLKSLLS